LAARKPLRHIERWSPVSRCRACGWSGAQLRFCTRACGEAAIAHLHRRCDRCRYEWLTNVAKAGRRWLSIERDLQHIDIMLDEARRYRRRDNVIALRARVGRRKKG